MVADQRPRQNCISNGGKQQHEAIEGNRQGGRVVFTHPTGGERDQGKPEQQMKVGALRACAQLPKFG